MPRYFVGKAKNKNKTKTYKHNKIAKQKFVWANPFGLDGLAVIVN